MRADEIPSSDAQRPKYRWVLLSVDGADWIASTSNEVEGLPAFRRMVELGEASRIVDTVEG